MHTDINAADLVATLSAAYLEDIARRLLTSYLVAEATGESIEEVCRLDVLVEMARLALPADVVAEAERDAAATASHLAFLSA